MALNYCGVAPPPSSFPLFHTDYHHHSTKLQLLRHKRPKSSSQFSLCATTPLPPPLYASTSHSSTTPIDEDPQPNEEPEPEPEPYPILNFFNSVQDTEFDSQNGFKDEEDQSGHKIVNSNPIAEGVLGEILDIARNVAENVTLGELLGPYEGRIGEKECVDLLGLMAQEGLVMGCLYFFKWMGLQEPSLITPRACSVLFPVLGRGGMGDALVVLVGNLPDTKEFRDVHVYNAAISGLSCCGRCEFLLIMFVVSFLAFLPGWSIQLPNGLSKTMNR